MYNKIIYHIIEGDPETRIRIMFSVIASNLSEVGKYIKSNDNLMIDIMEYYVRECVSIGGSIFMKIKNKLGLDERDALNFNKNNKKDILVMKDVFNSIHDKDILYNIYAVAHDGAYMEYTCSSITKIFHVTNDDIDTSNRIDDIKVDVGKLFIKKN